ncbi:MAG: phosphate ABC transporter substrate-binding protein [Rhodopirellula sp.]|nr:phosphate ABC transporter substrate-binding protein [Rhodopirellula sp.]
MLAGCGGSPENEVSARGDSQTTGSASPALVDKPNSEVASSLSGKLTITGSSTIAPLIAEVAARFEERHPDVRIDVQSGGSSRGIADVRSESADIGMASRAVKPSELPLTTHQIAVDGICLIVHKDNPVMSLTDQQVVAIFRGDFSNWKEVGGDDLPIVVVNKAEGRGTLEVFLHHFQLENVDIDADVIVGENQQGIKTVAGNPSAIAYVSIGTVDVEMQRGTTIHSVSAGEFAPTTENVASGKFPITRPLLLVTQGELSGLKKAFVEFALSSEVTDLIEAQYFVAPKH